MSSAPVADAIRRALSEHLTLEEACSLLLEPEIKADDQSSRIVHEIIHFVTDSDLRLADPAYDVLQKQKLRENLKLVDGERCP